MLCVVRCRSNHFGTLKPQNVPSIPLITPLQRFHNEVRACTLLHHGDVEVVPLVGVYSTETHPFCLVYEYMDGLDLRQHLRSEPNVGRLELVLIFIPTHLLFANHPTFFINSWRE